MRKILVEVERSGMTRLPVRRGRAGMICERRSVKWVEVVEVEVIVEVVVAVAADGGRAGWAVPRPPVQRAVASALTAGTASRTSLDSPVTRQSAHSAAH